MEKDRRTGNVYVAPSDIGSGVFAARDLMRGAGILNFAGPLTDADDPIHRTEEGANLLQIDDRLYLVPEPPGVFVNHSCRPNAGLVNTTTLIALRDIRAGEEIRFDYSTTMDEDLWTLACRCGASTCRGLIRDFKYLPPDLQQSYLSSGIVQPFIVRKTHALP